MGRSNKLPKTDTTQDRLSFASLITEYFAIHLEKLQYK